MKNLVIVAALAFTLAGCATSGGLPPSGGTSTGTPTTATKVADGIRKVQSYTAQLCGFVPTVATLTSIFNRSAGDSISTIGAAICGALNTAPLADGPGRDGARAYGVVLRGKKL